METIFDKELIRNNCEEFYGLYDVTTGRIYDMCLAKIIHTRAVAENCSYIAQNLGLDKYDSDLAWIIGELHDFARFGQIVVTQSFKDTDKFNHARLGARLLFTHKMIEDIIPNYYDICEEDRIVMEKAVYYHSHFHLPEDLTEREHLFCQLIRDADQLDIFRTIVESGWKTIYNHTKEEILATDFSDEIAEAFYNHTLADYSKRVTFADYHMAHIALCFGLQSKAARKQAMDAGYLREMMDIEFTDPEVQEKYLKLKVEVEKHLKGF